MIWYFPSFAGDFRLSAHKDNDGWSSLEIVEPTPGELQLLTGFLELAHQRGWTKKMISPEPTKRRKTVRLRAPVAESGKALVSIFKPGDDSLTAVTYEDGEPGKLGLEHAVCVVESADTDALAAATAAKKKPKKATSVKRPTPCCPQCEPGAIDRASEVLLSFLSPRQHEQWAKHRAIEVQGHRSGHTYVVAHRHSELATQMQYICGDLTDGGVLHFHDWSVPPEEEVLATKLCLEHREPWLRNEATLFGPTVGGAGWRDRFNNPFGDIMDGTKSSYFTSQIGAALLGLVYRAPNGRPLG